MIYERNTFVRIRAVLSALLALALVTPLLAGCGRSSGGGDNASSTTSAPMGGAGSAGSYGTVPAPRNAPQAKQGMSTGKKLAILAGTAALIYLYNKHKNAKAEGAQGKYYQSKNGRIYYRDAKGNAVWVTPPQGGIQVPQEEADVYNHAAQSGNFDIGDSNNFGTSTNSSGAGLPPGPRGM